MTAVQVWEGYGKTQFSAWKSRVKTCRQLENGIQAIFGPTDPLLGAHIQSICEALDVPHVEARIDFEPAYKKFSINLHPSQQQLNNAIQDIMIFLNWTKVAIIYEEDYGLFKLQDLVKSPPNSKTEMYIRQANPSTYRHVLKEIRQKEIYKLLVDTNPAHTNAFFRALIPGQVPPSRFPLAPPPTRMTCSSGRRNFGRHPGGNLLNQGFTENIKAQNLMVMILE
ncbi:hypothetical protein RUM44_004525 [Polyplax serrata]|uniref:Receptor ligand binding region domain-containing protein n=1 Tax=Polyplax serrata TaxID=468196 RepID=A0ABR1B4T6_POLSC